MIITSPDMCRSLPTTIEIRMKSTITARVEFAWMVRSWFYYINNNDNEWVTPN